MYPQAYKEWIEIFNDDLLNVWQKEQKELQKTAMLLSALQKELKNVQTNVEVEVINIKQQLRHRDVLKERKNSMTYDEEKRKTPIDKENEYDSKLVEAAEMLEDMPTINETESPDLFRNILSQSPIENHAETSVIDLSLSDENIIDNGSPTIKKRRKHHNQSKVWQPAVGCNVGQESKKTANTPTEMNIKKDLIKVNLFKTPAARSDNDLSVIENTPEIPTKKPQTNSKVGGKVSRRKPKGARTSNTLTQMLGRSKRKLELTTNKNTEHDEDSDETYFEDASQGSRMGITDLLSYVNKDETTRLEAKSPVDRVNDETTFCEMNMDSSEEIDEFSKGAIFNETEIATSSEKPKVIAPEPEPVVRGNARKQLQGWACEQCKNFYGSMKLPPKELKKKMDECSRHRYKYNPPPETLPGFWDLSIPPENPK